MNGPDHTEELAALCAAAIEGRLTDAERTRLERLVLESPGARRFYVERLHLHGSLRWSAGLTPNAEFGMRNAESAGGRQKPQAPPSSFRIPHLRWLAAAAAVAGAVWLGIWRGGPSDAKGGPAVATLVSGKACKWEAGTLPTEFGARLPAGRLRLADGLARIVFDNGAEITLEAPADLEVVSDRRCVLHAGRLVAKVPPPAIGFIVDTPTAVLRDLGTEFGVSVSDGRTADVQVFDGIVDATHRGSGRTERMLTGKNLRFAPDGVAEFDPNAEAPAAAAPGEAAGARVLHISTATGRGRDAYVQPIRDTRHRSDVLLLVKSTSDDKSHYNRKAYIGLDLSAAAGMTVVDAQLSLSFAPTGMGFASEVPDATFAVYGLLDEAAEGWDERTIDWAGAPANRPGGVALDPKKVVRLGTFQIVQGELRGSRNVSGKALVEFLNRNTNAAATFIVVRETRGSGRNDLVHGFAGKRHPELPPPTLRLTVAPRRG